MIYHSQQKPKMKKKTKITVSTRMPPRDSRTLQGPPTRSVRTYPVRGIEFGARSGTRRCGPTCPANEGDPTHDFPIRSHSIPTQRERLRRSVSIRAASLRTFTCTTSIFPLAFHPFWLQLNRCFSGLGIVHEFRSSHGWVDGRWGRKLID